MLFFFLTTASDRSLGVKVQVQVGVFHLLLTPNFIVISPMFLLGLKGWKNADAFVAR